MTQTAQADETTEDRARKVRDMAPAELAAGLGALPDAPLDMPDQVIERPTRMVGRLNNFFPRLRPTGERV